MEENGSKKVGVSKFFTLWLIFLSYVSSSAATLHLDEPFLPESRSSENMVSKFSTLWLMKLILYVSSSAATVSLLLPQLMVDGTIVPFLFGDLPNLYQIFLISTVFAFVGAFSCLMNQHKPRVERFFRIIAVASILFALAIVLYATALWLRWGYLNDSGQVNNLAQAI